MNDRDFLLLINPKKKSDLQKDRSLVRSKNMKMEERSLIFVGT